LVALAAGLVLLQAMLVGLSTAHAAALAANPFAAAICHGAGSADPASGSDPDGGPVSDPCCAFCTAVGSAMVPDRDPVAARLAWVRSDAVFILLKERIALDPRAVRAGSSQAPPSREWD
jgi:DUF2946 family protein